MADNSWLNDNGGETLVLFLKKISKIPLLTKEEEIELGKRVKAGDKEAIDKLIVSNLRLVVTVAKKYLGLGIPLIDLIQEGTIGLQTAAKKFDYTLNLKFSTYATYWIRQSIAKSIIDKNNNIRLPANVVNDLFQLNKKKEEFIKTCGREPNFDELLEMSDMPEDKLLDILQIQQGTISLDTLVYDGDNNETFSNYVINDQIINPLDYTDEKTKREMILTVLDTLDDREKEILIKRFGFDDGIQKSLTQVGDSMNLTRERVRQIEMSALTKLRNPARAKILSEYM